MTDTLKLPSPMQLRAELEDMVRRDLLGPAGGPYEEIVNVRVLCPGLCLVRPDGRSCEYFADYLVKVSVGIHVMAV